ncbi:nicotinate phosphoribosyltransferase [Aspergillus campestris IBT 28561]|uniref:nicotinate phosphoribosyltransferase n=1 Tax=Aspergillus campestris (strain IBT 28561) TaxID=1392248 RepID=A0A2I1CSI7_ASPC2|nr:nicotinate phosphoribosyltransferase [Aspergillus campestris IBT 28561]PKY00592.1 nicotinate phosphoribosyltransferase [Aspergillus campestris IBT 28561]
MGQEGSPPQPEGVSSLLDTDLYKLTMQCAVLKYFPDVHVTYGFTNRTPDMQLSRGAYKWILQQIERLGSIRVTPDEIAFLKKRCPYFNDGYLDFLSSFKLKPSEQLVVTFTPEQDTGSDSDTGSVEYLVKGLWLDTILYEIPLLSLTSQAYFMFIDKDWDYSNQEDKAFRKGCTLLENDCAFSEFGTRRRRDYHTQDIVMTGLQRAVEESKKNGWSGVFTGTSNVHFAMKYDVNPVGTVAHEWYMGIAAITNDYRNANEMALRYWLGCFGEGVLGIALTDTFGTPNFLDAFRKPVPAPPTDSESSVRDSKKTYADVYTGVRQDSGDPRQFVKMVRDFYHQQGIQQPKTIVFSDSLNIEHCLDYKSISEEAGFKPTFGVGTFFTNDYINTATNEKSKPLNIVIKIASANGRSAVKLSDNLGKNTGDKSTVLEVKKTLGYVEQEWEAGDEGNRWSR